jgi:lipoate-protein ligase B
MLETNESFTVVSKPAAKLAADRSIQVQDLGLVGYSEAFERQLALVDQVHQGVEPETMIFCSHPPVVTLGRGTREGDVFSWKGETVQVNRGGRATYHGPNQIVIYPILNLGDRGRDLHLYMRTLEAAIIATLGRFGIQSSGREEMEATGVWIGPPKIASIGIGVRNWITFHGLALNVAYDPQAFQGLNPCGFSSSTMISMEEILGGPVDREAVSQVLRQELMSLLVDAKSDALHAR